MKTSVFVALVAALTMAAPATAARGRHPTPAPVVPTTVQITSAPTDPTTSTTATFAFQASGSSVNTTCQLDSRRASSCSSPKTYSKLAVGEHTFTVTASGKGGTASASDSWSVVAVTPPPVTPPPVTPPPVTPPSGIQAPIPPSVYTIPTDAVLVSSSSTLVSALSGKTKDIELADGTYDAKTPFEDSGGYHLYAQDLGGAILTAGLVIDSTGGSVQGVTFNITSMSKTLGGGEIQVWGSGTSSSVLDCTFYGNKTIEDGLLALNPTGLVAQRLQFYDFTDVALWASDNTTVAYGAATPIINSISDIYVNGVSRAVPGSSNGTGEAGLWIGHPVANGVQRIETHNVGWSGIETVNDSWNTTFTDLSIDMSGPNESCGVGIYLEHFNYHNTFENFSIRGANTGINAEWDDPDWGGVSASHFTTIENGTIDATGANDPRSIGVYLDEGTDSTTITGVTFLSQAYAAIVEYKIVGTNNISGNDFSGIMSGAASISTSHP